MKFLNTLWVAIAALSAGSALADQEWQYQFSVNGCDTGSHTFDSKDAYCSALNDDALHQGCAGDLRSFEYDRNCASPDLAGVYQGQIQIEVETDGLPRSTQPATLTLAAGPNGKFTGTITAPNLRSTDDDASASGTGTITATAASDGKLQTTIVVYGGTGSSVTYTGTLARTSAASLTGILVGECGYGFSCSMTIDVTR